MIQNRYADSRCPRPTNSRLYGESEAADIQGTRNYMGMKDPAIDALIAAMLQARERTLFRSAVRRA